MNRNIVKLLCVLYVSILSTSCTSTKQITYLTDLENVRETVFLSNAEDNAEHKIENNDLLNIHITSPTNEENAYRIFDNVNNYKPSATTTSGGRIESSGYLVNTDGNITIPLLGSIKASGLTKTQLKESIIKKINDRQLLIDPLVEIRYLNFEVTVLGEVLKPTVITVPNEKISLVKALGVAGDITAYGRRDNVVVIREQDGKKIFSRVDMTSHTFLQSQYYYLQPNDVVYVESSKNRAAAVDRTRLILPSIISAISVAVLVIDRVTRK